MLLVKGIAQMSFSWTVTLPGVVTHRQALDTKTERGGGEGGERGREDVCECMHMCMCV